MLINCGHVICFKCLNSQILGKLSDFSQNKLHQKLLESSICCLDPGCKTQINIHEIFDTILESRAADVIASGVKDLVQAGKFKGKYICPNPKCDEFVGESESD